MGKLLIGIFVAVASLLLVESLDCNKCSYGFLNLCLSLSSETCSTNTSVCATAKTSFPSLSTSVGFNSQSCREPSGCNATTNGTISILNLAYQVKIDCCSSDKCNPTSVSAAPSTKMTFAAAVGAAALVSVLGSML